jgi:hypothetical protein
LNVTQFPITDTVMLLLGFPLDFFASGIFSGMGAFLTKNFPTPIRGSGQGFITSGAAPRRSSVPTGS